MTSAPPSLHRRTRIALKIVAAIVVDVRSRSPLRLAWDHLDNRDRMTLVERWRLLAEQELEREGVSFDERRDLKGDAP